MNTPVKYLVYAINDEEDSCSCCGKTGLKRVVWLQAVDQNGEKSEPLPYGTTCAYTVMGRVPSKSTKAKMENYILAQMAKDKETRRSEYFQNECFLDIDGKYYIEKKYKIGRIMQEMGVSRDEAVDFIRTEMRKEHSFLN